MGPFKKIVNKAAGAMPPKKKGHKKGHKGGMPMKGR